MCFFHQEGALRITDIHCTYPTDSSVKTVRIWARTNCSVYFFRVEHLPDVSGILEPGPSTKYPEPSCPILLLALLLCQDFGGPFPS